MTTRMFEHSGNHTIASFITNLFSTATFACHCQLWENMGRLSFWKTEVQDEVLARAHQCKEGTDLLLSEVLILDMVTCLCH